ncbi:PEP-CTERM sorting domain-containing protein [Piscinibacter sakaiensis]|uniref:PEP-CTERM sorting domain-containing protein n=1 Tax=Piscinibacter sakaiensis TaxID=1547922 RepID=UPI003AAE0D73
MTTIIARSEVCLVLQEGMCMNCYWSEKAITGVAKVLRAGAALALALSAGAATAVTVVNIGTGVDASGSTLATSATDPRWDIVAGPGVSSSFDAVVASNQHQLYFKSPQSMWISTAANARSTINSPYTYQLVFDLTGYDASTARLDGSWSVDNYGSILFNGHTPNGTGTLSLTGNAVQNYRSSHSFSITGGFLPGLNTLQFRVTDTGNPAGLNVQGNVTAVTAVPEPSTLALFGVGLLAVWVTRRRTVPRRNSLRAATGRSNSAAGRQAD